MARRPRRPPQCFKGAPIYIPPIFLTWWYSLLSGGLSVGSASFIFITERIRDSLDRPVCRELYAWINIEEVGLLPSTVKLQKGQQFYNMILDGSKEFSIGKRMRAWSLQSFGRKKGDFSQLIPLGLCSHRDIYIKIEIRKKKERRDPVITATGKVYIVLDQKKKREKRRSFHARAHLSTILVCVCVTYPAFISLKTGLKYILGFYFLFCWLLPPFWSNGAWLWGTLFLLISTSWWSFVYKHECRPVESGGKWLPHSDAREDCCYFCVLPPL